MEILQQRLYSHANPELQEMHERKNGVGILCHQQRAACAPGQVINGDECVETSFSSQ